MESVNAHMVITEVRIPHFIKSEDLSSERHTGENIAGNNLATDISNLTSVHDADVNPSDAHVVCVQAACFRS